MRVHFRNDGQYESLIRHCIQMLRTFAQEAGLERPRRQRPQNEMCRGFGYSNYRDLQRNNDRRAEPQFDDLNPEEQLAALTKVVAGGVAQAQKDGTDWTRLGSLTVDDLIREVALSARQNNARRAARRQKPNP